MMQWRMWRWWWRKGRSFGFVFCKKCHHRWAVHYAYGYRCNHPLDPEEWDVDYGCRRCEAKELDGCGFGSLRDE